jgi:hypothetical protein
MAPQRRGVVAAPSLDPTRQANLPTQLGRRPPPILSFDPTQSGPLRFDKRPPGRESLDAAL